MSVGVGGVTTVAGLASNTTPGGVLGSLVTRSRGFLAFAGEGVFSPGSAKMGLSSKIWRLRLSFRGRPLSASLVGEGGVYPNPRFAFSDSARIWSARPAGEVSVRFTLKASFSLPTGEGLRRADEAGAWSVCEREEGEGFSGELARFSGSGGDESTVSVVMRGDEAVR